MSFGAFLSGMMGGYQAGQNLQDQVQQRKLRDFRIKELEEEQETKERAKGYDAQAASIVRNVGVGLDGDGMGPQYVPQAPAPDAVPASTGPVDDSVMRAAPGDTPAQVPVGLPAGNVGPGQPTRPAAIESAGQVAAQGVTPPTETMPKTTIMGAKKTPDFYAERLRLAKEKGDVKLVERFQEEQVKFLVNDIKRDDAEWARENADLVKRAREAKTLDELAEIQDRAQQRQLRTGGTILYLWSIGAHDAAREASKHSSVFGKDWSLKEIRPGADGKIEVVGSDDKVAMTLTPEQARQFVQQSGAAGKADDNKPMLVPDGGVVFDPRTKQPVFENKRDQNANPERANANITQSNAHVEGLMGVKRDSMGNLMAGVTPEMEKAAARVKIRAAQLVRSGMPPEDAAEKAVKEAQGSTAPKAAAGAPALPPAVTKLYKSQ